MILTRQCRSRISSLFSALLDRRSERSILKVELQSSLLRQPPLPPPEKDQLSKWRYFFSHQKGGLNECLYRERLAETGKSTFSCRPELLLNVQRDSHHLGKVLISLCSKYCAYIQIPYSKEQGDLIVKSFKEGETFRIRNVYNFVWTQHEGSSKIMFTRLDEKLHSSRVFCFDLHVGSESLLFQSENNVDFIDVSWASDQSGAFILCTSRTSSLSIFVDNDLNLSVVLPRLSNDKYYVDRIHEDFLVVYNKNKSIGRLSFLNHSFQNWNDMRPLDLGLQENEIILDFSPLCGSLICVLTNKFIRLLDLNHSSKHYHSLELEMGSFEVLPSIFQSRKSLQIAFSTPLITRGSLTVKQDGTISLVKRQSALLDEDDFLIETFRIFQSTITLVYRKGANPRNPNPNPCVLYSYGVYGEKLKLCYRYHHIPLLKRGFVIAYVDLHQPAIPKNKRETCDELVNIAKYLKDMPGISKLVHETYSAGAVISAAAIGLFDCVVWRAPFLNPLDSMMDPSLPLSLSEVDEWGDPRNSPEDYHRLLAFSPFQNLPLSLPLDSSFPHLMITHGLEDLRVNYKQSVDYVSRVEKMFAKSRIVLNLVPGQAHSSATLAHDIEEKAKELEFVLDCVSNNEDSGISLS